MSGMLLMVLFMLAMVLSPADMALLLDEKLRYILFIAGLSTITIDCYLLSNRKGG